jgi:hypothetical protein
MGSFPAAAASPHSDRLPPDRSRLARHQPGGKPKRFACPCGPGLALRRWLRLDASSDPQGIDNLRAAGAGALMRSCANKKSTLGEMRSSGGPRQNADASIRSVAVTTQPIPRLFNSPAGNSEALGNSNRLSRAQLASVRFGVTHLCGVGRSTEGKQKA